MSEQYKQSPYSGVDLDSSFFKIAQDKAAFIKNMTYNVGSNESVAAKAGFNLGVLHPFEGSQLLKTINFPAGYNYTIGYYESKETNTGYVFVYNSNNNHFIYKIDGNTAGQAIVYQNSNLNFQFDPKNFISEGRCTTIQISYTDPDTFIELSRTYLIFVDNNGYQRFISVEDSIATNSFTTSFFNGTYDKNLLIHLGVPTPLDCIQVVQSAIESGDAFKQNRMNYKPWYFRLKTTDVYNRESEHGIISTLYLPVIGSGCISNSNNYPHCVDLTFDAGIPLVDKIQIEFSNDAQNWFKYDVLDKYDNSNPTLKWYQRPINPDINYNSSTNKITYKFCGDKECEPIDINETNRTQNPIPDVSNNIFRIDKNIALANNIRGHEPLNPSELAKITVEVTPPEQSACSDYPLRKVIIYVSIFSPWPDKNKLQTINKILDADVITIANGFKTNIVWGQAYGGTAKEQGQTFPPGQKGFIGYFAGTRINTISKQVMFDVFTGNECEVEVWDENSSNNPCQNSTGKPFQKFEFEVPSGVYVFRIAHHLSQLSENYQATSAYVYDQITLADPINGIHPTMPLKELVIDATAGDVILNQPASLGLMIWDVSGRGSIMEGYLREDTLNRVPIELAPLTNRDAGAFPTSGYRSVLFTDHNGFYFHCYTFDGSPLEIKINDCITNYDIQLQDADEIYLIAGVDRPNSFGNNLYANKTAIGFDQKGVITLKGDIFLCDNHAIGIAGFLVILKNGAFTHTDVDGHWEITMHNRYSPWVAPFYIDQILYAQVGGCLYANCDSACDYNLGTDNVTYIACSGNLRSEDFGDNFFQITGTDIFGLQNGGRYGWGIWMHDVIGRHSFVQATPDMFIDIPSIVETKVFNFSKVAFNISNTILFPDWVKGITFALTNNLNFTDFLSWIVDEVQFVDTNGVLNNVNPAQIRIYYGSLNEYNKQYGFATNSTWQFTVQQSNQSVIGDQVEFITKGDDLGGIGSFFDKKVTSLVQFDQQGQFITIDYIPELKDLKKGALIKIYHPYDCSTEPIYYELCNYIPVVNNTPTIIIGDINAFDSYMLSRSIPIPVPKLNNNGTFMVSDTNSVNQANNIILFNPYDTTQIYPALFEHHSPSDLWGSHAKTNGRINVKNPYERQVANHMEIALSKDILNKSNFNGLSYFDILDAVSFDEQTWGKITCVITQIETILVICEYANFLSTYYTSNVNADPNGGLTATQSLGRWSRPQKKMGNGFGCQIIDINTIRTGNGNVMFVDRAKSSLVLSDFVNCIGVEESGYKGYLLSKIAYQNGQNNNSSRNHNYIFVSGYDPNTKEYFITAIAYPRYPVPPGDSNDYVNYINNLKEIDLTANETMVIDMGSGLLKGHISYTPEYYGALQSLYFKKNFFYFQQGGSWFTHPANPTDVPFNNFSGVQCKKIFQVVVNPLPEKVKRILNTEVYCSQHVFIMDKVLTEQNNLSRINRGYWIKGENLYAAQYLCDMNTPNQTNPLLDGTQLSGRWIMSRYISDNIDDGKYCEVSAVCNYWIPVEKSAD